MKFVFYLLLSEEHQIFVSKRNEEKKKNLPVGLKPGSFNHHYPSLPMLRKPPLSKGSYYEKYPDKNTWLDLAQW